VKSGYSLFFKYCRVLRPPGGGSSIVLGGDGGTFGDQSNKKDDTTVKPSGSAVESSHAASVVGQPQKNVAADVQNVADVELPSNTSAASHNTGRSGRTCKSFLILMMLKLCS
jgi:hypothetical protein